jgi:uncharacterized iron-regulated membrane protein
MRIHTPGRSSAKALRVCGERFSSSRAGTVGWARAPGRAAISGKARDFNRHNVFGIWCANPLVIIVLTAVVMSYPWATQLLFRRSGSPLPRQQLPEWQAFTLRVSPDPGAPVTVSLDCTTAPGNPVPAARDRSSRQLLRVDDSAAPSLGNRFRLLVRFGHTGERWSLVGQTIAGLASAAAAMLVWTGIALTWRRFRAWQLRRATQPA